MKKILIALFITSLAVTVTSCTKDETYSISPCDHDGRTQTGTLERSNGTIVKETVMTSPANPAEGSEATYETRYYIQLNNGGWSSVSTKMYPCNLPVEFQRNNITVELEGFKYEPTSKEKSDGVTPISLTYLVESQPMVRGGC